MDDYMSKPVRLDTLRQMLAPLGPGDGGEKVARATAAPRFPGPHGRGPGSSIITMPLLQLRQITLRYSSAPLLDRVDFQVDAGERICLLGRNGAGKTSLMRIITGEETPNDGEVIQSSDTRMTRLSQEIPGDMAGSVREVIHAGLRPDRHEEEWQSDVRIEELMEEMKLPPDREFPRSPAG